MLLKFLRFTSIIVVALLQGLAFAHLLERPAKMQYDASLYITLQKTLYVQWGPPNFGTAGYGMNQKRVPSGRSATHSMPLGTVTPLRANAIGH